jgi:hypothetical protein
MSSLPLGFDIDYRLLLAARAILPGAALVLLLWDLTRRSGRTRAWRLALATVGTLSFLAWWNFGALHGRGRPIHVHDVFHYYLGSKYYAELNYTHIYRCAAVWEVQRGGAVDVARRWSRDLVTNELEARVPTSAETEECLTRFGETRWREFSADLDWFRARLGRRWDPVFRDRGFNATPVWTTIGYWLSGFGAASDAQILSLALLDVAAILIMWIAVWRTFGWEVACVALTWWGVSGGYGYLGGAFLRNDAYVLATLSICAMKVGRPVLAGGALAAATVLRIFPVVLLAGLGVKVLFTAHRDGAGTAWRRYRRFAAGFLLCAISLLAFSAMTWASSWHGILEPWQSFADNTRRHMGSLTANQLGLHGLLAFDPTGTMSNVTVRQATYWVIVPAFGTLFALRARFLHDWELLVFSVAFIPVAATMANYYYTILLVFTFLWPLDRLVGIGLVAVAFSIGMMPAVTDSRADAYLFASVGLVLFSVFVLWRAGSFAIRPPETARGERLQI